MASLSTCNIRSIQANIDDGDAGDSKFTFEPVSGSTYKIKWIGSKTLYLTAASAADGAAVTWAAETNDNTQRWEVKATTYESFTPIAESMLNKFEKDTAYHSTEQLGATKVKAMVAMGRAMASEGYHPAFIAGMMSNVQHEGNIGLFEYYNSSQAYMRYMNTYYNYSIEYSGAYIYKGKILDDPDNKESAGKNLITIKNLLETLQSGGWQGQFGLGSIQWTGERTLTLVKLYLEITKGDNTINPSQAMEAEVLMIKRELGGTKLYANIYFDWVKKYNGNFSAENVAYDAGYNLCLSYEVQPTSVCETRGNVAKKIYNRMKSYN